MEDTFKKFLYSGVGLVTSTIEKAQSKVNELVEEGKITENEGKKVVDDLLEDIDQKKDEYEGKVRDLVENVLAKFDFPTRREVEELESKIIELENQLATKGGEKKEPTKAKKREA
ncbi:MAG: phasin family protein [Saprospiraceae bacterium]